MKTRLTFLQTIAFALALARWLPLSAQTQGGGELKPAPQTNQDDEVFNFPGGTPRDFLAAVEKHYKADWLSIASIPPEMEYVRVPKLRIPPGPVHLNNVPLRPNDRLMAIVALYNRLAEHEPQLGTLVVEGDANHPEKPYAVMLARNKSAAVAPAQMKTKVFPLRGIPEKDWDRVVTEISLALGEASQRDAVLQKERGGTQEPPVPGLISIHRDSALLVVVGSASEVEISESVVAAFQANQRAKETRFSTENK